MPETVRQQKITFVEMASGVRGADVGPCFDQTRTFVEAD
jgi:hypothetical protein